MNNNKRTALIVIVNLIIEVLLLLLYSGVLFLNIIYSSPIFVVLSIIPWLLTLVDIYRYTRTLDLTQENLHINILLTNILTLLFYSLLALLVIIILIAGAIT